ncbi:imidazole glycerol phosphate synthase subunit HisH [Parvularcula flava]|uniref:Imidazole glycerol phosphate synthase subunit HisH n=1 Tax=Aquisalinus luteolus TaxID=1566827 RepID=A0A8J3EUJ6_9PROT|nr:imidazole glycerol phosphate synthase subunit HisH [Aquisalinus luteolus]NHK28095.1 imidazole glycerol phosphate synthase subunit HisH [Aquisalinus luteolus]GGH97442.1 imidazole glycerol phosphate synthase subunit HisH [Aquisalinus luteolus]
MQKTVIIDYGSGNLHSALKAFERVIAEHDLATSVEVTSDADAVTSADRIVLPGVGAFASCHSGLMAVDGMVAALEKSVLEAKRPFLGICVGMQLLASGSEEFGSTPGLGWLPGTVKKITPRDASFKVPHMGWNVVSGERHAVLPNDGPAHNHAYFVHSYHMVPDDPAHVLATTDHGGEIVATVGRDNILGVQFHPEKSQAYGMALIRNFLTWEPEV